MRTPLAFLFSLAIHATLAQGLTTNQIDSLVARTMERMPLAGIAIAVVKDGKVVHSKGYGVTSIKSGEKTNENTLFAIASNSKAFTTAALGILVDEGKISWHDKVIDYIPEFKMYDPYVTANFNIVDLLTHRSGLGLGAGDLMFFPDGSDFTIKDVIASFQYQRPVSAFRTKYDYDNLLYVVAGEVVARVSGMSWSDFVRTRIMEPLGMTRSAGVYQKLKDKKNTAAPHAAQQGVLNEIATYTKNDESLGAAGGVYASVSDLTKWMFMHLNDGKFGPDLGKRLISTESHAEMWRPHTFMRFESRPDSRYKSHLSAYGLGWRLQDRNGHIEVSHTGGLPGMLSKTTLYPALNLGVVVLTNTDPGGYAYQSISASIVDAYLGVPTLDWIGTMENNIKAQSGGGDSVVAAVWKKVANNSTKTPDLKPFEGSYKDNWFGKVTIALQDGSLWFTSSRSPKLRGRMYFYNATTFAVKWDYQDMPCDAFATFVLDEAGVAQSIKMKGISPNIDFSFDFHDLDLHRISNH
jgi:CubicO group peptidase (beta-lactamase class C family)